MFRGCAARPPAALCNRFAVKCGSLITPHRDHGAIIGAAGLVVALDLLQKKPRDRVTTVPTAWYDNTTDEGVAKLKTLYDPDVAPTDPVYGPEKDFGHFTAAQEKACKGPGE